MSIKDGINENAAVKLMATPTAKMLFNAPIQPDLYHQAADYLSNVESVYKPYPEARAKAMMVGDEVGMLSDAYILYAVCTLTCARWKDIARFIITYKEVLKKDFIPKITLDDSNKVLRTRLLKLCKVGYLNAVRIVGKNFNNNNGELYLYEAVDDDEPNVSEFVPPSSKIVILYMPSKDGYTFMNSMLDMEIKPYQFLEKQPMHKLIAISASGFAASCIIDYFLRNENVYFLPIERVFKTQYAGTYNLDCEFKIVNKDNEGETVHFSMVNGYLNYDERIYQNPIHYQKSIGRRLTLIRDYILVNKYTSKRRVICVCEDTKNLRDLIKTINDTKIFQGQFDIYKYLYFTTENILRHKINDIRGAFLKYDPEQKGYYDAKIY